MKQLNIFIDGTWLFNQCAPARVMANSTDAPEYRFALNFEKLNTSLLSHIRKFDSGCAAIGDCYLAISIFDLPADFSDWPDRREDVTVDQVERTRRGVDARNAFANEALQSGYSEKTIFRPKFYSYILKRLTEGTYQEKLVDSSVVALLVRSAITKPGDYHAVVSGDADMLPAIQVAYPEFTENVLVVSTHPDEIRASSRQASAKLFDVDMKIDPFFLQEHTKDLISGNHAHHCVECGKTFATKDPIPRMTRPRCRIHGR